VQFFDNFAEAVRINHMGSMHNLDNFHSLRWLPEGLFFGSLKREGKKAEHESETTAP